MRKPLPWLLLFTFLHGLWYAVIVHPWQAPDEYLHYEYMRLIDARRTLDLRAEDRSSAIQWEVAESMWEFEHYRYRLLPTPPEREFRSYPTPLGSRVFTPQPPLYYLVTLPIYKLIARWSTLSQLYVLRVFSVLLQVATTWLTFELSRRIFSRERDRWMAIFPAAFIAMLPQYTFISASYNNDNLAPPLIAASLLMLVRGYQTPKSLGWFALAGLFGALALTAKRTAVGILPVLFLALIAYALSWLRSDRRRARINAIALLALLSLLALAGVLASMSPPTIPAQIARHLRVSPDALVSFSASLKSLSVVEQVNWRWFAGTILASFWGNFGWLTIPAPAAWLSLWQWGTGLLVAGVIIGWIRYAHAPRLERSPLIPFALLLAIGGLIANLCAMLAQYLISPQFYPPQGRYLFPFISILAILGAWSWASFWPEAQKKGAFLASWMLLATYDLVCWGFVLLPTFYA